MVKYDASLHVQGNVYRLTVEEDNTQQAFFKLCGEASLNDGFLKVDKEFGSVFVKFEDISAIELNDSEAEQKANDKMWDNVSNIKF